MTDANESNQSKRASLRARKAPALLTAGLAIGAVIGSTWLGDVSTRALSAVWDAVFGKDEPALVADVQQGSPYGPIGETVVLPGRSPADLPDPPNVRTFAGGRRSACPTRGWVKDVGGAPVTTEFTVYLEGRSERTVRLSAVDVEVTKRRPPIQGFTASCTLALKTAFRHLEVNLLHDTQRVRLLRPVERRRRLQGGGTYIDTSRSKLVGEPFSFTLRRGEIESFVVSTDEVQCWCLWQLRFNYVVGGSDRTLVVDDDGQPFETSSASRASHVNWDRRQRGWKRSTPRLAAGG
ncbi:MAG TPA: hypothetical protein VI318_11675 [Baekduia sp.]